MIRIYHIPGTRALRVVWLAEEMGLKYELQPVQGFTDPKLTEANALGSIPVLEDGEVRIIESLAIMDYLMDRYGPTPLKPNPTDAAYPAYIQFFHFGECTMGARFRNLVVAKLLIPEDQRDNWATADSEKGFITGVEMIGEQLQRHPYLAGDQFTAADISCTLMLGGGAKLFGWEDRYHQAVRDYLKRVTERPAYQRASAAR
ncbi:MAG: glutathione S-transferase family protein [Vitreimonas sp.]